VAPKQTWAFWIGQSVAVLASIEPPLLNHTFYSVVTTLTGLSGLHYYNWLYKNCIH